MAGRNTHTYHAVWEIEFVKSTPIFIVARLLTPLVALTAGGAEPAHPLFPPLGDGRGAEKALAEFTEEQFLEFVPRQSPRSGQPNPTETKPKAHWTNWKWDPRKPNEIRWGDFVYPNPQFPPKVERVEVLSGKTVEVPYFDTPNGRSYVQGEIDHAKRIQLWRSLRQLAAGYTVKHDERFARRIAVALDAWATYVPDYYMNLARHPFTLASPAEAAAKKWNVQRCSDHNGFAHEWDDTEIRAFDAIWKSRALRELSAERGYDVRAHIAKNYFANIGDFLAGVPIETATGTNLCGTFLLLAETAVLLGRPDYIEWLNKYLEASMSQNFIRDGMYPESFGYHSEYANGNLEIAETVARYFALYPASTDALREAKSQAADRLERLQKSAKVQQSVALPNGNLAPFDDTTFGGANERKTTRSVVLPAYGHLALGDGEGPRQTQLNMQFNDWCNHVHQSMLSVTLFAFGQELVGHNRYAHGAGRGFLNSTMSHNTVTIDRTPQMRGKIQLEGNAGHLFIGGDLELYEPGLAGVALADVDGSRAYLSVPDSRYRRLVMLNTVDETHPYVLDVFQVGGGRTHDYFLHGAVAFDETAEASFPLQPISEKYPLLEGDERWVEPKGENGTAPWYGVFREMSTGRSPGKWHVTFRDVAGPSGTRIHAADDGESQVFLGKSPVATRKNNDRSEHIFNFWRPTLLIRRQAANGPPLRSLFVTVIEPLKGESTIASVERLPLRKASQDSAALRITFTNGREDVCLVNMGDANSSITAADDSFRLQGRFGLVAKRKTKSLAWLIAGEEVRVGEKTVSQPAATCQGVVSAVMRRREGDAADAFVTQAALPEDVEWKGRWLSLKFGRYDVVPSDRGDYPLGIEHQAGISQMFQIDHVERRDGKTVIHLTEDPWLAIESGKATELLRPHRTFTGPCRFEIALSRHVP